MDMTRNGSFVTGFFQGLVVVFFVYVVIFTVTIVKSRGVPESATPLASATAQVTRMNPQPQVEAVVNLQMNTPLSKSMHLLCMGLPT